MWGAPPCWSNGRPLLRKEQCPSCPPPSANRVAVDGACAQVGWGAHAGGALSVGRSSRRAPRFEHALLAACPELEEAVLPLLQQLGGFGRGGGRQAC